MLSLVQDTFATVQPISTPSAAMLLILGIAALIAGGHLLVTGASNLAHRAGVSPLMIGLTIVAFGTSAPELALNVVAVWESPAGAKLAWGNIVGSNMANIGLVLGLASLISPLRMSGRGLRRNLGILLGVTAGFIALMMLPPGPGPDGSGLAFADGLLLLAAFILVCVWWFAAALRADDAQLMQEASATVGKTPMPWWTALGLVIAGLVLLLGGAGAAETGAVDLARNFGVSETVIGLTIVAVATSLPEVSTAVVASMRNENDMAVGTIIGSNLFNIVLVMGVSSLIQPIGLPAGGTTALVLMAAFTVMLAMIYLPGRTLGRAWGGIALAGWIGVMVWSVVAMDASPA